MRFQRDSFRRGQPPTVADRISIDSPFAAVFHLDTPDERYYNDSSKQLCRIDDPFLQTHKGAAVIWVMCSCISI